jgi:hypothetical protein
MLGAVNTQNRNYIEGCIFTPLANLYDLWDMSTGPYRSERFKWLTEQIDAQVTILNNTTDSRERSHLLRRMKVLLNELDALHFSSSERSKQDITRSNSEPHGTPPE